MTSLSHADNDDTPAAPTRRTASAAAVAACSLAAKAAQDAAIAGRGPHVERWLNLAADLDLVVIRVAALGKGAVDKDWPSTGTRDFETVERWLAAGSNIGAVLGPSRLIAWEADNASGTAALRDAGLALYTVSAGSQDPHHPHAGGVHTYWRVPACWPTDVPLHGAGSTIELANGGKIDVLAGPKMVLLPPSVVATPGGVGRYMTASEARYCAPEQDGWLAAEQGGEIPELPLWAWPETMRQHAPAGAVAGPVPPLLEPLVGRAGPKPPPVPRSGESDDALTLAVDDLDFLALLDDAGVAGRRVGYFSCGPCENWLRAGSASDKSITVHDCLEHGARVQVWSTSLPLAAGGYSRLDAYAGLTGKTRAEAMQELGLGGGLTTGDLDLEPLAVLVREPAPRAAVVGDVVAGAVNPTPGVLPIADRPPVAGAAAVTAGEAAVTAGAAAVTAGEADATDDDATDDDGDGDDMTPEQRERLRKLRPEIAMRERKLATMTPGLARADRWARSAGVYLHGLVACLIPRSLALVPPNVVLPGRGGLTIAKALGTSVNAFALLAGPSAAGKSATMAVAAAAIPLDGALGIRVIGDGTAEGICRSARNTNKGKTEITATSVLVEADEFDTVAVEMGRTGSKLDGFTRKVWIGAEAGSSASDDRKNAPMPRHSTRVGLLYGTQPAAAAPLLAQAGRGTPQRFDAGLAGIVRKAERDPNMYGKPPRCSVLERQDRLPWNNAIVPTAGAKIATVDDTETDVPSGLAGYDDASAIWIGVPEIVQELADLELERAAERAADWALARREDASGISGHNVLLQEKMAFALATWDGECNIAMTHWDAAGLLLEMRALVFGAMRGEVEVAMASARTAEGENRGLVALEAKAAEAAETARRVQATVDRIMALVDAAGQPRSRVYVGAARANPRLFEGGGVNITYLAKSLSKPQRPYVTAALKALRSQGAITGDPVIRRPGLVAAPRIGSVA